MDTWDIIAVFWDKRIVVMRVIYLKIIIYIINKWNLINYYLKKTIK